MLNDVEGVYIVHTATSISDKKKVFFKIIYIQYHFFMHSVDLRQGEGRQDCQEPF